MCNSRKCLAIAGFVYCLMTEAAAFSPLCRQVFAHNPHEPSAFLLSLLPLRFNEEDQLSLETYLEGYEIQKAMGREDIVLTDQLYILASPEYSHSLKFGAFNGILDRVVDQQHIPRAVFLAFEDMPMGLRSQAFVDWLIKATLERRPFEDYAIFLQFIKNPSSVTPYVKALLLDRAAFEGVEDWSVVFRIIEELRPMDLQDGDIVMSLASMVSHAPIPETVLQAALAQLSAIPQGHRIPQRIVELVYLKLTSVEIVEAPHIKESVESARRHIGNFMPQDPSTL